VRRGDTHVITSATSGFRTGRLLVPYGSGAKPIMQADAAFASSMFSTSVSSGGVTYTDHYHRDIVWDGDSTGARGYAWSASATGTLARWYFEGCEVINVDSSSPAVSLVPNAGTLTNTSEFGWLSCTFTNPDIAKSVMLLSGYSYLAVVGCSFSGGNGSTTLDHYIYPSKWDNRCFAYNNFGTATAIGYCINNNSRDGSGALSSYIDIRNNTLDGGSFGIDFSNSTNAAGNGDSDLLRIADNLFSGTSSYPIYGNNVKLFGVARNRFSAPATVTGIRIGSNCLAPNVDVSDNDAYSNGTGAGFIQIDGASGVGTGGDPTGRIWSNRHAQAGTGYSHRGCVGSGTVVWEQNQALNANANPMFNQATSSAVSLATWQADDRDTDLVTTDPGFADPTNGYFLGPVPTMASTGGLIVAIDGGTHAGSACDADEVVTDTWRIYNSGDKLFSIDTGTMDVTGDGTLATYVDSDGDAIAGAHTLYPGDYVTVTVTRTTSVVGAKSYTVTFTRDTAASTFDADVTFDVNAVTLYYFINTSSGSLVLQTGSA
jgi:hypothetical protein